MKTTVKLWLSQLVSSKDIEEIRYLTQEYTPDKKSISVLKDESEPKLVIVTFDSHKGTQTELADKIGRNYWNFLETYKDIAIQFHPTQRNNIKKKSTARRRS